MNNEKEKEYYRNIIRYKINLFRKQKSNIFNYQNIDNDVYEGLFKIFNNINIDNILQDNLSLLLSLDYKDGIRDYFNSQLIDTNNLGFNKLLNKRMSLGEYIKFWLGQSEELNNDISYLFDNNDFILYSKVYDIDYNYLPEGVKYFNSKSFETYLGKCERFRPIIFSSTIKDINIHLDSYYEIYYVLPEVIDHLYIYDYFPTGTEKVKILMPLEITKSVRLPNKLDNIDLMFRKDIIDFNRDKLYNYFYCIFHSYLESMIGGNEIWYDELSNDLWDNNVSMKSKDINTNEFFRYIKIKDDRGKIEYIPVNHIVNSMHNEGDFDKFILYIADSILKYRARYIENNSKLSNTNYKTMKLKADYLDGIRCR